MIHVSHNKVPGKSPDDREQAWTIYEDVLKCSGKEDNSNRLLRYLRSPNKLVVDGYRRFYLILFGISLTTLQFYKWSILPYSSSTLTSEFVLLVLLVAVEFIRIQLGKRGNLTNKTAPLVASIFLLAPSFLAVLYSLLWQSYVLRLEVVLCGVQIAIQAITFVIFIIKLISIITQPMAI